MNRSFLFLVVIFLSLFSCEKSHKASSTLDIAMDRNPTDLVKEKSIDELWDALLFEKSSCLIGSGYFKETGIPDEYSHVTFKDENWKIIQAKNKKITTDFLLTKLSDTVLTRVHNCPNLNATQGEMAVYALQNIHHKNWWDFNEFSQFKGRISRDVMDHPQVWLQDVLSNAKQREQLTDLYRAELDF